MPNGKKIARAYAGNGGPSTSFELFDYDNSTGIVSHAIPIPLGPGAAALYGTEFSPDSKRLYFEVSENSVDKCTSLI